MGVNADTVARYKYVSRGGKVDGFYSGNTFANQLGISMQVPNKVEIVSNNMAAKVREVPIGKRTFIVTIITIRADDFGHHNRKKLNISLHKNVQIHIKWEWILKFNLFCDRMSLLKNVQIHGNGECNDGD